MIVSNLNEVAGRYLAAKPEEKAKVEQERIDKVAREFTGIINGDYGKSVVAMLKVSDKFIRFGEEEDGPGFTTVYILTGDGLRKSCEASGSWTAYSKEVPKPKLESILPAEAVEETWKLNGIKPEDFINWFYGEADKIVDQAPSA